MGNDLNEQDRRDHANSARDDSPKTKIRYSEEMHLRLLTGKTNSRCSRNFAQSICLDHYGHLWPVYRYTRQSLPFSVASRVPKVFDLSQRQSSCCDSLFHSRRRVEQLTDISSSVSGASFSAPDTSSLTFLETNILVKKMPGSAVLQIGRDLRANRNLPSFLETQTR